MTPFLYYQMILTNLIPTDFHQIMQIVVAAVVGLAIGYGIGLSTSWMILK
jgi:ABC-type amino acid transport system permease subunit